MTIKPTSAYENISIYYIKIVVNLLHVSVTFCGHLQGGAFPKDMLQRQPSLVVSVIISFLFVFLILRKNTSLKMATEGDRNMYEVYDYNVIN
jgi:hypothetical protein